MVYDPDIGKFSSTRLGEEGSWFDFSEGNCKDAQHMSQSKWLKHEKNIPSACPEYCFPFKISLQPKKLHGLTGASVSDIKSFMPLDLLHSEFGVGVPRDPETLDDSDLEILAEGFNSNDNNTTISKKIVHDHLDTNLVVNKNSLHIIGSADEYGCPSYVIDCKVLHGAKENDDDILLIITDDGILYAIVFDEKLTPTIVQWWDLSGENSMYGTWNLSVHAYLGHFVVFGGVTVKFFKLIDKFSFELVSNLNFEESKLTSCTFLQGRKTSDQVMLFVSILRLQRLMYCIVEWDNFCEEKKEVFPLTLLSGETIQTIFSLDQNRCLIFNKKTIQLVSANQIMSGDPAFSRFDRSLFGTNVKSCFDDPLLLSKLKQFHPELADYAHCSVFATSNSALCCSVINGEGEIRFLGLTRFRGLRDVFMVSNRNTPTDKYAVLISSFGRIFELTLDVRNIELVTKDYKIPSLQNIYRRRTADAGYPFSETLMFVEPAKKNDKEETQLWLTSQLTLSRVTIDFYTQNTTSLMNLGNFQFYNDVHIIDFNKASMKWKTRILGSLHTTDSPKVLIVGTSMVTGSRVFLTDISNQDHGEALVELDDILSDNNADSLAFFLSSENVVQVSSNAVYVDDLKENGKWCFRPSWKIDFAVHYDQKVVMWNRTTNLLLYTNDIDDRCEESFFQFCCPSFNKVKYISDVTFIKENETISLLVASNGIIYRYSCDMISNGVEPFEVLNGLRVHFLEAFDDQLICCDQDGRILYKKKGDSLSTSNFHQVTSCRFQKTPCEIRFYDANTCIVFTPISITLIKLDNMTSRIIPLTENHKKSSIINLKISKKLMFILFSDGLEIWKTSYVTKAPENIVVKSSQSVGKKYIFLRKINRMLIVDRSKKTFDCAKLENGKLMSLDSRVLKDFDRILDVIELRDVTGVITLAIAGSRNLQSNADSQYSLKVVQIIPRPGRLVVKELARRVLENVIKGTLKLAYGTGFWVQGEKKLILYKITTNNLEIKQESSMLPDEIMDFDAIDDMVAVVTTASEIFCECKKIDGKWTSLKKYDQVTSTLHKISIINHDCIVASGTKEGYKAAPGVLLFYNLHDGELVCYNSILFAAPIKDFQYSFKDNRMCVLLNDGSIESFKVLDHPYKSDGIVAHRTPMATQDALMRSGCWPMNKIAPAPVYLP